MTPNVRFSCTTLAGTNKKGKLPKDEFGYYIQPIGGLNCFNSVGEYYPYEAAKQLFESSSAFMRRVSTGCLKAEEGHPKPLPGMTRDQFAQRVMSIDEKNVCAHIAEIYLDFNSIKDQAGRPIVAIMGKIKPAGPHGAALEESYNNPKEEVCFSIRAFTDDQMVRGVNQRQLVEIVTFDKILEPGIFTSKKFYSPALEELGNARFDKEDLIKATAPIPGIALENNLFSPTQLFRKLGWDTSHLEQPNYLKW